MEVFSWIQQHWLDLFHTGSITVAFFFAGSMLFLDQRSRRVANLVKLTEQHQIIWERMFLNPRLKRVLDPNPNLKNSPVTQEEEMFVVLLILHFANFYYAMKPGFFKKPQGLHKDVQRFFSLPIPWAVWQKVKDLQEEEFVAFVEDCFRYDEEREDFTD